MTAPGQQVFVHLRALMWTGSNGADIADLLTWQDQDSGVYSVAEEYPGDYLRMTTAPIVPGFPPGQRYVYAHSPWVVIDQCDSSPDQMPQASFEARYIAPPVGAAPNITIGVVSALAPGAAPEASITGTTPDLVLNLGIPSGGYLAGVTAQIPAAALLSAGTRTLAVTWPRTLPTASYEVDFLRDNTLTIGSPYTYTATGKTTTGFTLNYTNASLLTLGSGVLHCIAYR